MYGTSHVCVDVPEQSRWKKILRNIWKELRWYICILILTFIFLAIFLSGYGIVKLISPDVLSKLTFHMVYLAFFTYLIFAAIIIAMIRFRRIYLKYRRRKEIEEQEKKRFDEMFAREIKGNEELFENIDKYVEMAEKLKLRNESINPSS